MFVFPNSPSTSSNTSPQSSLSQKDSQVTHGCSLHWTVIVPIPEPLPPFLLHSRLLLLLLENATSECSKLNVLSVFLLLNLYLHLCLAVNNITAHLNAKAPTSESVPPFFSSLPYPKGLQFHRLSSWASTTSGHSSSPAALVKPSSSLT